MKKYYFFTLAVLLVIASAGMPMTVSAENKLSIFQYAVAASSAADDKEQLKVAAIEGLITASPERALPIIKKVLAGNHSNDVKNRALFVLGQIELPEANALLSQLSRDSGPLQIQAIRMVGIGGDKQMLAQLADIYRTASVDVRESVLQAYMIADDTESVFQIASTASNDEEFDTAIRMLGAMNATDELRLLLDKGRDRESLMQAYAIAGDLTSLTQLANDAASPQQRINAIRNIGVIGDNNAKKALIDIYRQAADDEIKAAALQGLLISDHHEGIVTLFRASNDAAEKRKLLRTLINMDSDLALEMIDSALEEK